MADQVILRATAGPLEGRVFVFEEPDAFLFGRGKDCHASVSKDSNVSRHHFLIKINPPRAHIVDLRSLNGFFINGVYHGGRVAAEQGHPAETSLADGDRIEVGATVFEVEIPIACVDCGQHLSETLLKASVPLGDRFICPLCHVRAKAPTMQLGDISHLLTDDILSGKMPALRRRCGCCGVSFAPDPRLPRERKAFCPDCAPSFADDPLAWMAADCPDMGDHLISRKLAEGGQGVVYLGQRRSTGETVAIKILQAELAVQSTRRDRFHREIEVMARLDHPNVVRLLDHGSYEQIFFFVMEYLPGGSLMDRFQATGPLPLREALDLMRQTLIGLDYIHQKGVVHRDIKPQNLLLTQPEGGQIKIADLGVAKNIQEAGLVDLTQTGTTMGSLFYMAREQLTNFKRVTPAADVWALASTFYRMITGQLVYNFAQHKQPIAAVLEGDIIPISGRSPQLPPQLCALFDKALSINTEMRYQSAGECLVALDALV